MNGWVQAFFKVGGLGMGGFIDGLMGGLGMGGLLLYTMIVFTGRLCAGLCGSLRQTMLAFMLACEC